MAKSDKQQGTCYLCGNKYTQRGLLAHIRKAHDMPESEELCLMLKVEGADDPNYWLLLDMPAEAKLSSLDTFLRKIWLECCGHMSAFYTRLEGEISMSTPIGSFAMKGKLMYDYDFGSTTTLTITPVGVTSRPAQRNKVRLLARNDPFEFSCEECGKPAIRTAQVYEPEYRCAFWCSNCLDAKDDAFYKNVFLLPVTNSPRMGECGYCGELDRFAYIPKRKNK